MKRLTLLISDIVALYGSLAAVLLARYSFDQWPHQWALHVPPFTLLFVAWVFSFYIANLYEPRTLRNGRDFYGQLVQAVTLASVLSIGFFYLIPYFGIAPRVNLFLFIAAFAVMGTFIRIAANAAIALGTKERIVIVGLGEDALRTARFVRDNPQLGYAVRALVRVGQEPLPMDVTTSADSPLDIRNSSFVVLDDIRDLDRFIVDRRIDTVVISPSAFASRDVVDVFYRTTLARRVNFVRLAEFSERLTGQIPLGAIDQIWFLDNIAEGSKRPYEVFKRGTDVVAALLLGIPTLAVTPFIAAAIKLTSPGPVLFTQLRTGRGGIPFTIFKFRTMRADAEASTGAVWATDKDPRITRVGKFLRTSRLDELPQLFNILRGEMSLVGPRAERPEFDAQLEPQIPFYRDRYLIRPGLSGWAQINYPYGSSVHDSLQKLQYDLYYIKHRSLALDLEIILKTINISLRRAGR
jgi:exopolysaccharide biosynthesis polyprenyl glycosylphosphotransferase